MTIAHHRDETSGAGSPADRAILEERARSLARPFDADDDADDLAVLGFTVAGRTYALEVRHVREVLVRAEVSRLPWTPATIAGVMNIRGEIVAVADTAGLLGLGEAHDDGPVVVVDGVGHVLGLRVDAVGAVTAVAAATLAAPEGDSVGVAAHLVLGLTASAVVLDARALSADPRLSNHPQEGT